MQVHLYHSWCGNSWPISQKTMNDFNSSPPFGLFDIFNHLIYHSTNYVKQGIAAYKSFDDSRLFNDGYMESLLTTQLKQEGVHVYIAEEKPFIKLKRDDRKDYSDLWFILAGRGANCGSVLQARCKCKGGRDGGCKHIAAAMYALEDLLNSRGKDSLTSGPCFWARRQACEVKDLVIEKSKKPSHEKRKCKQVYSQNIEKDVRAPEDTNSPDEEYLWEFAKQMCHLKSTPEKNPAENAKKLVEESGLVKSCPPPIQEEREPQNAREWGLLHEESARKAHQRVASHTHHKLKLIPKGFLISPSKLFLGASVDNIQKCQCSDGCSVRVVEYKWPWKHRDLHPKQAFLTPEIGRIQNGKKFALKSTSNYYFQVQLQMFVSGLTLCIFVVWTNKGIFTVEVPCDPSFMSIVCAKLEKFWTSQVLPFLISEVSMTSFPGK